MSDLVTGDDGKARCGWGTSTPDYVIYHDAEWGRPTTDERTLFEKLCLEGFQSGLSWLTILRKRPAFRQAFANFDANIVADFSANDVERLLGDASIIRHRGKIEATINNAKRMQELWQDGQTLAGVIWSFEPPDRDPPADFGDVPATTEQSSGLSKALKKQGFKFVGPTTAYAAMQAMGVVNDHLKGCTSRAICEQMRAELDRPLN